MESISLQNYLNKISNRDFNIKIFHVKKSCAVSDKYFFSPYKDSRKNYFEVHHKIYD